MRAIGGTSQHKYEKVAVDEWLSGIIDEVQFDPARTYKVKDEDSGEWEERTAPHVRLKFKLEGYQWPHYSRWMQASTHKKSNLYSKYLKHLCPKFDCQGKVIDLDRLIGVAVRTMWENNGDYQNLTQIRGVLQTLNLIVSQAGTTTEAPSREPEEDEEPPL